MRFVSDSRVCVGSYSAQPGPQQQSCVNTFSKLQPLELNVDSQSSPKTGVQVWTGAPRGTFELLYLRHCFSPAATYHAQQVGALSSDSGSPSLKDLNLGSADADNSCVLDKDLSDIMVRQGRCLLQVSHWMLAKYSIDQRGHFGVAQF